MSRPESEDRCRRHPKHRVSKGVCPFCLRERLSHLKAASTPSSTAISSSTNYTFSPHSSDSNPSSVDASPRRRGPANSKKIGGRSKLLTKSRLLAVVLGGDRKEEEKENDNGRRTKKRGRFWSKVMDVGSGRRREDGILLHSKTMKERSSTKWVLFS